MPLAPSNPAPAIAIELSAVIFMIREARLEVLCLTHGEAVPALPAGGFDPMAHRTFERAVRDFVTQQTGHNLGYVEQLYSFGDEGRIMATQPAAHDAPQSLRVISIGYLALLGPARLDLRPDARFVPVYDFFPYEDRRAKPKSDDVLNSALTAWAVGATNEATWRIGRYDSLFPATETQWNEERVLDRYELTFEAGLVPEAGGSGAIRFGRPMLSDHRRILATALSRLRGKLKYRPVVFDLMPPEFTLFDLQQTVEIISGLSLHKQNFRRAMDRTGLVRRLNESRTYTGGRPAALYAVDADVLRFMSSQGLSLPRL